MFLYGTTSTCDIWLEYLVYENILFKFSFWNISNCLCIEQHNLISNNVHIKYIPKLNLNINLSEITEAEEILEHIAKQDFGDEVGEVSVRIISQHSLFVQ